MPTRGRSSHGSGVVDTSGDDARTRWSIVDPERGRESRNTGVTPLCLPSLVE
jgi:hypothetical protein